MMFLFLLGDTTGIHWNLQINYVTAQDGGHYKCALSDLPSKVQVSSLTVTGNVHQLIILMYVYVYV